MMKQIKLIFLAFFFAAVLSIGCVSAALVENASVNVGAIVPSKACPQYSSIVSNVSEILADNSQKVTITVKTYDCSNVALPDVPVVLRSNRGVLDNIYNQSAGVGNGLDGLRAITDENGFVFFEVYSSVPGEAIFTAVADDLVTIGDVKIKFLSLPFPKNVTVTIKVPSVIGRITGNKINKITILQPEEMQYDETRTVNLGVQIDIPFWVALFIFISILLNILLLLVILILNIRLRVAQNKEVKEISKDTLLLEKEEEQIEEILKEIEKK